MSIRKRDVHFSDWTKVRHALVCNNVQGITETSSFDDVRAFLINSESGSNPFYYYVCYIKETKEIYTHGQFYAYSKSSYDDTELRNLIGTKADLSALEALISEVEENEEVTAAALTELHENKADKSEIPDVSTFATKDELNTLSAEVDNKVDNSSFTTLSETVSGHTTSITNLGNNKADKTSLDDYVLKSTYNARVSDVDDALDLKADKDSYYTKTESDDKYATKTSLSDYAKSTDLETAKTDLNSKINLKQDKLTSGTNIKTVNGDSILGSGDIEIHDTKVTSAANHYGYNSNNATSTTGAFVTKITKDAANHVTSFKSRALTSTDIPGLDASKITSGTIDIARLPKGALEQLHHYETQELAQQAVIDKAVQLGDTVQINNAIMYICTNDSATTFATQFTEYVAGTAASVPWSGITGKPTGIDEWGNRIGVIESGYATQSWVGENYLSLSGGTMAGSITTRSNVYSWTNAKSVGHIIAGHNAGASAAPIISAGLESGGYGKLAQVSDQFGLYAYSASDSTPSVRFALYPEDGAIKIMGNTLPVSTTTYNLGSASAKWSNVYATSFIGDLTGTASGNLPLTGGTITGALKLGGTTATTAAIKFSRRGDNAWNYIIWPGSSSNDCKLAFGYDTNAAGSFYYMASDAFYPAVTNTYSLGKSTSKWSNVYATTFTGDTANIGTLQIITNEINGANGTGDAHINYSSTGKVTIANGGGNVVIGGTTADEKLHIHGNVKASGNMYATDFCTTSDNRLKDFTKDVIVDFNELKNIPKKYYYWKDKSMGEELQIGTSAQELAKVYPECVSYNEKEDRYSVNYQKLSIIALAAIDKLHERISVLEEKLNDQNS